MNKTLKERRYSMIEPEGLKVLLDQVEKAPPGVIVIAGTAHGGDAMAIIEKFPDRYVVVIDSFEGLAPPIKEDGPNAPLAGAHNNGGVDKYKANFADMGIRLPDEIHKMWITKDNLLKIELDKVALLFMDLDHYAPVKACLNFFKPQIVPDGIIITHDYGFWKTKGVVKACQEFAPGCWKQIRGFAIYTGSDK